MTVDSPLSELKGVGEALAQKFALLGVKTAGDLIDFYPRRYEDFSTVTPISQLQPGKLTIEAVIKQARGRRVRGGMHITEAIASDKTGSLRLIWFNQSYRADALKSGKSYFISGQYELSHRRMVMINPSVELVSDLPINTARILAVYPATKGLTSRQIRSVMQQAMPLIKELPESLPEKVIADQKLLSRAEVLAVMHAPGSSEQLDEARRRLGFEEVFQLSLASLLNKLENQSENALAVPYDEKLAIEFSKSLDFKLTDAQRLTVMRIYKDLEKDRPMNRLVEGDVGSGKTVVATMAALMVLSRGEQVALMAPTELLARQHADTIRQLLEPLGYAAGVTLLLGSMSPAQKTKARAAIADGKAGFIVGTHALIQEKVDMHHLALIIIDEQHRFGVKQRKTLMTKAGHMPHVLSLTATPIPRSLALALYGELDVSILDQKPASRQTITTEIVSPNSQTQLYKKIDQELESGRQMFVVCPVITDSGILDLNSVEKVYQQLSKKEFKHRRVGLLHGKLKADDKQSIMEQFVRHELDILVSTTVVEVGVDIPNASVMLIESPERFGLAQLHQLRGRVGRGSEQGYCYLLLSDSTPPGPRLRALTSSNDGFKLAELDLKLRGPGAFLLGVYQHGHANPLRLADLNDKELLKSARIAAREFIKSEKLKNYPALASIIKTLRETIYTD